MDLDSEDQNFNQLEKLNEETEKDKNLTCTPKFIILIIVGNLIFIAICIVIIYLISSNKVDKISGFMNDYIKDLNKIAITEKRIKHLVKSEGEDKYQALVDIQKSLFYFTWEKLSARNKTIVKELDEKISNFLFPKDGKTYENITESLVKVLTQKEDYHIYQLLDVDYLKTIMSNLEGDEKELNEKKLKIVILYVLINLPMQLSYYSNKTEIKKDYIPSAIELLKNNHTKDIINHEMEEYDKNNNYIYMVLGSDQTDEMNRINATDYPINLTNTGLRVASTLYEFNHTLDESLKYYTNEQYKELMKQCAFNMDDDTYIKFIGDVNGIVFDPNDYTEQKVDEINNIFNKYTFSVETANTVINYLNLGYSPGQIHIIQLGGEKRLNLIKYNETDAFILYNVYDKAESGDNGYQRATTEANVKAIKYLQHNYTSFLTEDQLKNIILVSTKGDAERQLVAFNIISNLYDISIDFNGVIWNNKNEEGFDENKFCSWVLEAIVKSYNLYCDSYRTEKLAVNDEIHKFVEDIKNITETYKYP